jgi:hypothetical protein
MANTLETLSWIAGIIGIPMTVMGWYLVGGKKKINKSVANGDATAISGDVRVDGPAGFVTGHNSPLSVTLTVGGNGNDAYERRYAVFRDARKLIDEAHSNKFFSDETLRSFVTGARDALFLFDDDGLVLYLNEIRERAAKLQSITMVMEGSLLEGQRAAASQAAGEHRRWLMAQSDVLLEKFRPFLQFDVRSPQSPHLPDWSIRDLFFHIRPDIIDDSNNDLWESVGGDVIDKFSTSQLKVWGRRIEGSKRLALAEIPPQEWPRAKFTYWFLKEYDGLSLDVDCYQSFRASAPLQYADLHVSRAQALTIWPKSPL